MELKKRVCNNHAPVLFSVLFQKISVELTSLTRIGPPVPAGRNHSSSKMSWSNARNLLALREGAVFINKIILLLGKNPPHLPILFG